MTDYLSMTSRDSSCVIKDNLSSKTHFFRAYETFTMLQSASQVDDQSDIKNAEVIRMQSFSRSLMLHILLINKHLVNCQKKLKLIESEQPSCSVMLPKSTVEATAITEGQELRESESLTETSFARLTKTHSQVRNLIVDTYERLSLLNLHDSCD